MDNKVLSIELGELKTKICIMGYRRKHPRIYQTMILDTPPGSVEDGFIQDKYSLAEAIVGALGVKSSNVTNVVFTIASTRIATHEAIIPMVNRKDMNDYVKAGASDYFPMNLSEYVISFMLLERLQLNQEKKCRVLVIAVNNFLLSTYFELAKLLKLTIVSIDYLGNSILQVLQRQSGHKETGVYIQFNEKSTIVNIMDNAVLKLSRTIGYGMETSLDTAIVNINRALEYYASKNMEHPVQTIYLSGTDAKRAKIGKLLSNEFGLQVKYMDDINGINMKHATLADNSSIADFMNCIGAALSPLGIFPKQYLRKEERKSNVRELIEIGAFISVLSIALIITSVAKVTHAESNCTKRNRLISELEQVEGIYTQNHELRRKLSLLTSIDESCKSDTEGLKPLLEELEAKLPKDITIQSLQANEEGITLDVSIDSMEAAAMTFLQLNTIKQITDVKTEKITINTDEYGASSLKYIITAEYEPSDKEE